MRRRSDNPTVTLFPFLAVLVCAMGALILLLLVTTRRIRHQAELQADAVREKAVAAIVEPDPEAERLAQARASQIAIREKEIAERMKAHQLALAKHEEDRKASLAHWESQLNQMSQLNSQLADQVSQERKVLQSSAVVATQLDEERQKLAQLLSAAASHNQEIHQSEAELQEQAVALMEQRNLLREKAEAAKAHQGNEKPIFEVVAYDGNSRTERRPILIECRPDSLTFASEGVSISAATLDEFSPDRNPLLAGTDALLTYWTLVDAKEGKDKPGPYVLLIVRPGGTVGFYVARRYLEGLHREYGYELVSADADIAWPPADPQAVDVCRTAVERALKEQRSGGDTGLGTTPGGRGGSSSGRRSPVRGSERIVDSHGEFVLAEVEHLKNGSPGDSIDMLGPEWQRRGNASAAGGRPGGSSRAGGSGAENQGRGSPASGGQAPLTGGEPGEEPRPFPGSPADSEALAANAQRTGPPPGTGRPASGGRSSSGGAPQQPDGLQGQPAGARGQRSQQGSSDSLGEPADQMPPSPFNEDSQLAKDGGQDRRWGRARSSGAIGIERPVDLHVYVDKIRIADEQPVPITPEMDRPEFQDTVANLIQTHALSWGEAPAKFVWRPAVKVIIHPGGNQHYPRIKELMEHWGLSCKTEYVLD